MKAKKILQYDLCIIGGGIIGMSLALALRHTPLRIALIEAHIPASSHNTRLFALTFHSIQLLKNIGLWPAMSVQAMPIHQVHTSFQGRPGIVRLYREDLSLPALGYVIPASHLEHALQQALINTPTITRYQPATLQTLTQHNEQVTATILHHTQILTLNSTWAIGADGTHSTVREQLNIATTLTDYQQNALVTQTTLKRSHHHIAYERFTSNGALALLPLTENTCATIWSADHDTITQLQALSKVDFLAQLQQTFGYRLGKLQAISERTVFPLKRLIANTHLIGSVLLIGNAAHTIHPILAQGLNIAYLEIAILAQQVTANTMNLKKASQLIQETIAHNLRYSHTIPQLFSTHYAPLKLLLSLGMMGLDNITSAKTAVLTALLGRRKNVPHLLLSTDA